MSEPRYKLEAMLTKEELEITEREMRSVALDTTFAAAAKRTLASIPKKVMLEVDEEVAEHAAAYLIGGSYFGRIGDAARAAGYPKGKP